jgi:hypothetical protein
MRIWTKRNVESMPLISERDREFLLQRFEEELVGDVKLALFRQRPSLLYLPGQPPPTQANTFAEQTRQILEELVSLSPKLTVEIHDTAQEKDLAQLYKIERSPTTLVLKDAPEVGLGGRIRFVGIPSGYEFATLIADIIDVSKGTNNLTEETRAALAEITTPVHIQVFVTPT